MRKIAFASLRRPRPLSSLPRRSTARRAATLALALGLATSLAGCGDGEASKGQPEASPQPVRWNVAPALPREQARFAFERVLNGPLAQEALIVPDQHAQSLRLAVLDLVALPQETTALLEDEAVIRRVTGPDTTDLNPWHSVLEVLGGLPQPDLDLVRRWTEPALTRDVSALWLLSVGCLIATQSPEAGPLALRFLEVGAADRIVSREAVRLLLRLPEPWPRRAAALVFAHGSPFAWLEVAPALEGERQAQGKTSYDDLLAWWALLAEQSGPRPATGKPRVKTLAYTDWAVAEMATAGVGGVARAPAARELDDRGWLPVDLDASAELPLLAAYTAGQEPAAVARCALAGAGRVPAVHAVKADREHADPLRKERATHCMLASETGAPIDKLIAETEAFLRSRARPDAPHLELMDVLQVQRRLPPADGAAGTAMLLRVLREARPVSDLRVVLETAHDQLASAQTGADERAVLDLLASPNSEDRGLGMHLAQRARKGVYLEPLLALEAKATPEGRRALRRALQWIAIGGGVEPAALQAHVRRYASWLDEAPDDQVLLWASGLLDLGEAGAAELVERLKGPRGNAYMHALREAPVILPVAVAEALSDLLSSALPAEARHELLVTLWRSAPAQASGAVAAAKGRLEPSDRRALDVVLEVVRHRAAH